MSTTALEMAKAIQEGADPWLWVAPALTALQRDPCNAILHSDTEAIEAQLATLPRHGRLAGVPLVIKDNLCDQGQPCRCASRILSNYHAPYTATVLQRLKNEGAIVIGRSNMDEFAMGSSTENSAYGPTFHPQDHRRVPGGSSGGSAAAVASGMVPIALGSDTGGSARQPAAFCGIVGFKPSYGRFSRYGLVSFASSLDCVATLSTSVQEAALLTEIMAGPDPLDASSVDRAPAPWLNACTRGIAGLRIGVLSDLEGITPGVQAALLQAQAALQAAGAQLEPLVLPSLGLALACYCVLAPAEASSNLARFDGIRYGAAVESEDLMTHYLQTRSQGFGAEVQRRILLGTFVLSAGYQDRYYLRAQALRQQITQELEMALQQYDLLLCPTTPSVAFLLGERHQNPLSMYQADILTVPASLSGLPAISVPCGQSDGLPVGAQLIGRRFDEASVFAGATVIERSLGGHR